MADEQADQDAELAKALNRAAGNGDSKTIARVARALKAAIKPRPRRALAGLVSLLAALGAWVGWPIAGPMDFGDEMIASLTAPADSGLAARAVQTIDLGLFDPCDKRQVSIRLAALACVMRASSVAPVPGAAAWARRGLFCDCRAVRRLSIGCFRMVAEDLNDPGYQAALTRAREEDR